MSKIIKYLFMFFIIIFNSFADELDIINLKDLDKVNKNLRYDRFVKINNGKLEIDQTPDKVYLFSTEKYYTNVIYSGQVKELSDKNKNFLKKWLEAKYLSDNLNDDMDMKIVLINNQVDLFYKDINIVSDGKLYSFMIQVPLLEKLEKNITKNTKIQVELMYLGKNYSSGNNFFLITDFSTKNIKTDTIKQNDLITAKKMISGEQYLAAIQKLTNFLKQYPNHLEAKKNICLAKYLNSLKLNNQKYIAEAINCYEDLSKIYETSEIYYTLSSLYYSINTQNKNTQYNNVLKYANKSIQLFKTNNNNGSDKIIYCNSLYLRGMAKNILKSSDNGIYDIEEVQKICPEMINVNLFNH